MISINIAHTRLLAAYGIRPDMTMGHSVANTVPWLRPAPCHLKMRWKP